MPTPRRTSVDEIVLAGRRILEAEGLESLTMQRVALAVGVRPPSLYKHVHDRGDLIRLIGSAVVLDLGQRLDESVRSGDPRHAVRRMLEAFRTFAHTNPEGYQLLFARLPEGWRADDALTAGISQAVVRAVGDLTGGDHALEAARTVVAWAHGFLSMELAGAVRPGGDVDEAFAFGIERITAALMRQADDGRS
jgi:AcrR family transcriptional regulator